MRESDMLAVISPYQRRAHFVHSQADLLDDGIETFGACMQNGAG
jgi:hypothetical protein